MKNNGLCEWSNTLHGSCTLNYGHTGRHHWYDGAVGDFGDLPPAADNKALLDSVKELGKLVVGKVENPKQAIGDTKIPLHLWPETATVVGALAMLDGACKYGRNNTRAVGKIVASTYVRAARSHLTAWFEGEDVAPDSGVHHLGHALACLAIIVDAEANGNLQDDRNYPGGYLKQVERLTPLVAQIKERHAAKSPQHYTIADRQSIAKEDAFDLPKLCSVCGCTSYVPYLGAAYCIRHHG